MRYSEGHLTLWLYLLNFPFNLSSSFCNISGTLFLGHFLLCVNVERNTLLLEIMFWIVLRKLEGDDLRFTRRVVL